MTTPSSLTSPPGVPALVTVPNVQLLEVGDGWETMTGTFSFTTEDLVDAISSQDDPSVRTPVVKLGHVDPRFDGQPSFGRIENLRLTNNDQTLVGDLVGVPQWLAACMSSAYPRRSIEGMFEFTSRTGNRWGFVLTGVALLGDAYPAIETLDDVQAMWGSEPPKLFPIDDVVEIAASGRHFRARRIDDMPNWLKRRDAEEVSAASSPKAVVKASKTLDEVRTSYYETLAPNQMWWWIRQVLVDPLELIVDDDENGLYRVPVTVNGDVVTFADPIPVKIEYVAASGQLVAASYKAPTETGRRSKSAVSAGTNDTIGSRQLNQEDDVRLTKEALARLGLPEDATEDAISAAILQLVVSQGDGGEGSGTDGNPQSQPETPATAPTGEPAGAPVPETTPPGTGTPETPQPPPNENPAAESVTTLPPGMALIDEATLQELKQGATAANQLVAAQQKRENDALLDGAVRAGKFPRARRAHYETLLSADPEGTKTLIASLAPGLVPVTETGTQESEIDSTQNSYPESWKPSVAASRRGVGSRLKVVGD